VSDGALTPLEAVEDYHEALRKKGVTPMRDLVDDSEITESTLKQD